jgi:hypothetical protein
LVGITRKFISFLRFGATIIRVYPLSCPLSDLANIPTPKARPESLVRRFDAPLRVLKRSPRI